MAVFGVRKRLSKEKDPPIDKVLAEGLVERLVHVMIYIEDKDFEKHLFNADTSASLAHKTRFECAW